MFYLMQFLDVIRRSPLVGGAFLFFSLSLIIGSGQTDRIDQKIFSKNKMSTSSGYFHALISKEKNISRVARKLRELPGVKKVKVLDELGIAKQVESSLKKLNLGISTDVFKLGYGGIRLDFVAGLKISTQNLVRDYLIRLIGKENLMVAPIKRNQLLNTSKNFWIKEWSQSILISILTLFCILSWFILYRKIGQRSYLVEQFQRKKFVALKVSLSGLLFISVVGIIAAVILGQAVFLNLLVVGVGLLMLSFSHIYFKRWEQY